MAINPSTNTTMAGRVAAASADYPYGSSQDESSPGAGDGTPYFTARANDIFGFQQALLKAASIVPSGNPDSVTQSQYMQAVVEQAAGRAAFGADTGAANAYVVGKATDQYAPGSLFNGLTVAFVAGNANTGAATLNAFGFGVKSILGAGAALAGGEIPAGPCIVRYNGTAFDLIWSSAGSVPIGAGSQPNHAVNQGQFSSSLGTAGWKKYPDPTSPTGYFIEQWGMPTASSAGMSTWNFPIPFPTAVVSMKGTYANNTTTGGVVQVDPANSSLSGMSFGMVANGSAVFIAGSVQLSVKGY